MKKGLILGWVLGIGLAFPGASLRGNEGVHVGFARADISRHVKTKLPFRRPLEVRALALEQPACKVLLLACDLMEISPGYARHLQVRVGKALGIPEQQVLIHTTHTHSSADKGSDAKNLPGLESALVRCGREALAKGVPAQVKLAEADVGQRFSVNRRVDAGDDLGVQTFWYGFRYDPSSDRVDGAWLAQNMRERWLRRELPPATAPLWMDGPVDPHVQTLLFADLKGRVLGSIVRFCAHPHIASALRALEMDSDYPGRCRDRMEQLFGGCCVFLSGPLANMVPKEHIPYVNEPEPEEMVQLGPIASLHPVKDEAGLQEMERIGQGLAEAAQRALETAHWQPLLRFDFAAQRFPVVLDPALVADGPARRAFRELLEREYRSVLRRAPSLEAIRPLANALNALEWEPGHWENTLSAQDLHAKCIAMPLAVLRLLDTALVFLHSEISPETGVALRAAHPKTAIWTVNLTGGTLNYLPPDSFRDEGGYEGRNILSQRGAEAQLRADVASLLGRVGLLRQ